MFPKMQWALPLALTMWLLLAGTTSWAATPTPNPLVPPPQVTRRMTVVPQWEKFEAAFTLPRQSGNPFDPLENDVQVLFREPGGTTVRTFAFWDGDRWKVRFAPTRPGGHTLLVRRNGKPVRPVNLTSAAFRCIPARAGSGFIRRSGARFVFDTKRNYYPVGINQAWTERDTPDYPGTFVLMRKSHMNWARVWMSFWDAKALDWAERKERNPPPGQFYLPAARRWDMVMDEAARNGVYVQLCLQHHGQYTNGSDSNWKENPFNAANGGSLRNPADFFTDAHTRQMTRAKYRYIVARWGYSTHLLSYELFNEVQNIGETANRFGDVVNWHKEMAAYVRSIDTNHHLITTSNSAPGDALSQIGLDYNQIHAYVPNALAYFAGRTGDEQAPPVFAAEWGPDGTDYGYGGLTPAFVHDGLWASLLCPDAGAGMMWYWEKLSQRNGWPLFGAAGAFVQKSGMGEQAHLRAMQGQVSGPPADLPLTLPRGWDITTGFDITVSRDGRAPDLGKVSSFIQGRNHRDMMARPITFHIQGPVQFSIRIGTAAKAGATAVVRLDGEIVKSVDYAPLEADRKVGETLVVTVPSGTHSVSLFNTGADWYSVDRITLSSYAPALAVLAKGNASAAFFWAYHRNRRGNMPLAGTITLTGLRDGTYRLRLWNTQHEAAPLASVTVRSVQGRVMVSLPGTGRRGDYTGDVAGSLVRLP